MGRPVGGASTADPTEIEASLTRPPETPSLVRLLSGPAGESWFELVDQGTIRVIDLPSVRRLAAEPGDAAV